MGHLLPGFLATGFAGVENPLFYDDNTLMLFGDARSTIAALVQEVRHQ